MNSIDFLPFNFTSNNHIIEFDLDYDTDEETDKLLGLEHRINVKNQAIRDAVCSNLD